MSVTLLLNIFINTFFLLYYNIYSNNKINKKNKKNKTKIMQKEQILGIVRHALTFIGGALVAKGLATEVVSNVLSIISKNK